MRKYFKEAERSKKKAKKAARAVAKQEGESSPSRRPARKKDDQRHEPRVKRISPTREVEQVSTTRPRSGFVPELSFSERLQMAREGIIPPVKRTQTLPVAVMLVPSEEADDPARWRDVEASPARSM